MPSYNGHKSKSYWNVSLWINNDEGMYNLARDCVRRTQNRRDAAHSFIEAMKPQAKPGELPQTPDGHALTIDNVQRAMVGMTK